MIKTAIAAAAAAIALAPVAALAGPYVNVESNSGFVGSDYSSSILETHLGYEGELGSDASWYVQGGPAVLFPDGGETTTELSGKVGVGVALSDKLGAYGEVSAVTTNEIDFDADMGVGVKAGLKYSF